MSRTSSLLSSGARHHPRASSHSRQSSAATGTGGRPEGQKGQRTRGGVGGQATESADPCTGTCKATIAAFMSRSRDLSFFLGNVPSLMGGILARRISFSRRRLASFPCT
ncbi:unnamed protein product, partial [Phaeothamnion confervicola]